MTMTFRLLLLAALVAAVAEANAQFSKGNFLAGGAVTAGTSSDKQYYSYNSNLSKTTNKNLGVQVSGGYFVMDNLAIGATIAWADGKSSNNGNFIDTRTHDYSVGIFARYYIKKFYLLSSFTLGKSSTIIDADGVDYELYRYHNFTGGIGYAFMLNSYVAIEPQLTYSAIVRTRRDDTQNYTHTGTAMLGVAFQFYFHR